jgi:hypothetical protein
VVAREGPLDVEEVWFEGGLVVVNVSILDPADEEAKLKRLSLRTMVSVVDPPSRSSAIKVTYSGTVKVAWLVIASSGPVAVVVALPGVAKKSPKQNVISLANCG